LVELSDRFLEAFQTEDQNRNVVEGAGACSLPQADFDTLCRSDMLIVVEGLTASTLLLAAEFVWRRKLVILTAGSLLLDALPHTIYNFLVVKSFVDTVATYKEKVKVILKFEHFKLWIAHNHVRVTSIPGSFGLDVAESSRNGQTTRENAQGPLNVEVLLVWGRCSFREGLSAIDLASLGLDTAPLIFVIGFVVSAWHCSMQTSIHRHYATAITNIHNICSVIYYNYTDRAASRAFWSHCLTWILFLSPSLSKFDQVDKIALTLLKACCDCLLRMHRELIVLHDKVMQIISQVVGTCSASMPIEDTEETNLGPFNACGQLLLLRF